MTFPEFPVYLSGNAALMEKHQTMGMNIRTPLWSAHRHTAAHQSEAASATAATQSSATVIDINEYAGVPNPTIAKCQESTWL